MTRSYTPNVQQSSIDALVESNKTRRLQKYPEDIYGEVGTEERRKNTRKCVSLRATYGITYPAYLSMKRGQGGVCAICKEEETGVHRRGSVEIPLDLAVDHCHETGEVRGLLCHKCNKGLGLFKDNPVLLKAAQDYLTGG